MPTPDQLRRRRDDSEDTAYERGRIDGEVTERLRAHDQHFLAINGSIERMQASLTGLTEEIRADRAARGAIQVAQEEQQARLARQRDKAKVADQLRLSFWTKLGIAVTALGVIGALTLSVLTAAGVA